MAVALHVDQYTFLTIPRSVLLRMKYFSNKCCRDNQYTHFVLNFVFFFSKVMPFMSYVEIYCRAEQATDDNMAHAHCMLDA
jgi:hypothetical protein